MVRLQESAPGLRWLGARRALASLGLIATLLLGVGCGPQEIDPAICEPVDDLVPVCGFMNPEDLELLPDGKTLVVSQYGNFHTGEPGSLVLYDTHSQRRERLADFVRPASETWANLNCPGPPGSGFSPHGIHLARYRDSDRLALLVVNHGGSERIDYFEVLPRDDWYKVAWRGCVQLPGAYFANDVVATPEGGFIFSHMYNKDTAVIAGIPVEVALSMLGMNYGYAVEWDRKKFRILEGSRGGFANGVQIDPTGKTVYVNAYLEREVFKIDRATGERLASAAVPHADNIQWDASGRLLVASHPVFVMTMDKCTKAIRNCGAYYEIVRLDPETLQSEVVHAHEGPPMGAATVAQQVGDRLYLGSFKGDRIVHVPYAE